MNGADILAVDIETFDPLLAEKGPGTIRRDGSVVCVGFFDGEKRLCLDAKDPRVQILLESPVPKVFHNSSYDMDWLVNNMGLKVNGVIHDTMTREALLDPEESLSLEASCLRRGIKGKDKKELEQWCRRRGINFSMSLMPLYWENPETKRFVFDYCSNDAEITWHLFHKQSQLLQDRNLGEAYDLECRMVPVLLLLRRNGVRINNIALDAVTEQISKEYQGILQELESLGLSEEHISSTKQLGEKMRELGIESPRKTKAGNDSWDALALERLFKHPECRAIKKARGLKVLLGTFLLGGLRDQIGDHIHCQFLSNKRETGGTVTGRFASSNPNMQNIPARDDKHGHEMRALFIPEEDCFLAAFDYKQIEFRMLAQFAVGNQAEWLREQVRNGADQHQMTMDRMGIASRKIARTLNFGIIYGMGEAKMLATNYELYSSLCGDMPVEQWVHQQFETFHSNLPVIKDTMMYMQTLAKRQGYANSLGMRRHYRPRPILTDGGWNDGLYKMTNKVLQGSAADITKKSMVEAHEAGILDEIKLHLQIHDELLSSVPKTKRGIEAQEELGRIMEGVYKDRLKIPIAVDREAGPDWDSCTGEHWKEYKSAFNTNI